MTQDFPIDPNDCLILDALERSKSIRLAAKALDKDASGINRKVNQVYAKQNLVKKIGGRWEVTEKGQLLIQWARKGIQEQKKILGPQVQLKISLSRWPISPMILPEFFENLSESPGQIEWIKSQDSPELFQQLKTDLAITTRPISHPGLENREILASPWSVVYPTSWRYGDQSLLTLLQSRPFYIWDQIEQDFIAKNLGMGFKWKMRFADLSSLIDSLSSLKAWTFLPKIYVPLSRREQFNLIEDNQHPLKFYFQYLKGRTDMERLVEKTLHQAKLNASTSHH